MAWRALALLLLLVRPAGGAWGAGRAGLPREQQAPHPGALRTAACEACRWAQQRWPEPPGQTYFPGRCRRRGGGGG